MSDEKRPRYFMSPPKNHPMRLTASSEHFNAANRHLYTLNINQESLAQWPYQNYDLIYPETPPWTKTLNDIICIVRKFIMDEDSQGQIRQRSNQVQEKLKKKFSMFCDQFRSADSANQKEKAASNYLQTLRKQFQINCEFTQEGGSRQLNSRQLQAYLEVIWSQCHKID